MIEGIPIWGSLSIISVLLTVIATIIIMLFRGDIATRKEVDQVQKLADTMQKAWEISEHGREIQENTIQGQAEVLNKLVVGQDTILKVMDALPRKPGETHE